MSIIGKLTTAVLATASALVVMTVASVAAGQFEGTWKVADTAGKPFQITLASDGSAKADRGEGMTGTWKEDGSTAIITWNTGWTTKIAKDGEKYTKTVFKKGDATGNPASSSSAEKVK